MCPGENVGRSHRFSSPQTSPAARIAAVKNSSLAEMGFADSGLKVCDAGFGWQASAPKGKSHTHLISYLVYSVFQSVFHCCPSSVFRWRADQTAFYLVSCLFLSDWWGVTLSCGSHGSVKQRHQELIRKLFPEHIKVHWSITLSCHLISHVHVRFGYLLNNLNEDLLGLV